MAMLVQGKLLDKVKVSDQTDGDHMSSYQNAVGSARKVVSLVRDYEAHARLKPKI